MDGTVRFWRKRFASVLGVGKRAGGIPGFPIGLMPESGRQYGRLKDRVTFRGDTSDKDAALDASSGEGGLGIVPLAQHYDENRRAGRYRSRVCLKPKSSTDMARGTALKPSNMPSRNGATTSF
jgi:hypothetical protein